MMLQWLWSKYLQVNRFPVKKSFWKILRINTIKSSWESIQRVFTPKSSEIYCEVGDSFCKVLRIQLGDNFYKNN